MNVAKLKQTHRFREQSKWLALGTVGREERGGARLVRGGRDTNYYEWNKLWCYSVQHREYSHYLITLNQV